MVTSRRWELMYLIASGLFVAYTLRVNISVTINRMTDEFNWTGTEKGLMLSSFYWGYTAGQLPASIIGQIYGAKWVFGFSILAPSILTLFVPATAQMSFGMALFGRVMIGLCASGTFPATYNFFRNWIPNDERTIMIPIVFSGIYLGEIISFPICGVLTEAQIPGFGGWQSCYYLFGLIGIAWFPFWARNAFEHPEQHPNISDEELKHIKKGKHPMTIAELDERNSKTNSLQLTTGNNSTVTPMSSSGTLSLSSKTPESSKKSGGGDVETPPQKHQEFFVINAENINKHNLQLHQQRELTLGEVEKKQSYATDDERSVSFLSDDEHATEIAERTPWMAFFQSAAVAALFINSFMADWTATMLLSEMPSFLTAVLGFSDRTAGILSMPPYVALFASVLIFGYLFEHLQQCYKWKTRTVRLWSQILSLGGSSLCLIVVAFTTDNVPLSYVFLIIAQFLFGAEACGVNCGYQDVSPNFSFSMNTIGNTAGSIAGFLAPIAVAIFTSQYSGVWGWRASFLFTAALSALALVIWYVFAEAHVIHDLNTPTTSRLCATIDRFFSSSFKTSTGSTKSRSRSMSGGGGGGGGASGKRSPRAKVRQGAPTVGNPMLEERLL